MKQHEETDVLVECAWCNSEHRLHISEIFLVEYRYSGPQFNEDDAAWASYTFYCCVCGQTSDVALEATHPGISMLRQKKVPMLQLDIKLENLTHSGPQFNEDDVIDFHEFLETEVFLVPFCLPPGNGC